MRQIEKEIHPFQIYYKGKVLKQVPTDTYVVIDTRHGVTEEFSGPKDGLTALERAEQFCYNRLM